MLPVCGACITLGPNLLPGESLPPTQQRFIPTAQILTEDSGPIGWRRLNGPIRNFAAKREQKSYTITDLTARRNYTGDIDLIINKVKTATNLSLVGRQEFTE